MKSLYLVGLAALCLALASCSESPVPYGKTVTIDRATLEDKVRGGWFAQTIGCTYGGPTEFRYCSTTINDSIAIPWHENYIHEYFVNTPGLFDDVYMDLTFLEVMAEKGKDAPVEEYADRFANAPYMLWHANQTARYNILNGIPAPQSGHWKYNPHADDIDFQIESDFIGMISPGRPDNAAKVSDCIGHIMNYGDGWYGGVYMGTMYALAYVCNDIETVIREGIKAIPEGTKFRSTIDTVLEAWESNPEDWRSCWQAVEDKFGDVDLCPDGAGSAFNIDASINAAYVTIGLLYGRGDFFRTIDIATRCGQDSDCNPASAAGILGVMYGYNAIPEEFRKEADRIQDETFPFTSLSLNSACEKTLELIGAGEDGLKVKVVKPSPVAYEQSFEGLKLVARQEIQRDFTDSLSLEFDGNSVCVWGIVNKVVQDAPDSYVAHVQAWLDGSLAEEFDMPLDYLKRKNEVFAKYCFEEGHHGLKLVITNPDPSYAIYVWHLASYGNISK